MSTTTSATVLRTGLATGWTEYRKSFSSRQDAVNYFGVSAAFLAVALLLQDSQAEGTVVPLGTVLLAGLIGFVFTMGGIVTVAQILSAEREDGTLLRARTLPRGLEAYVVAKAVHVLLVNLTNVAIILVPSFVLLERFGVHDPAGWWVLALVFLLAVTSTVPVGAVLGAVVRNPRTTMNLVMIPVMGLALTSGILTPITTMPAWAQAVGQAFPIYWVGLGTRSVFLPDAALGAEIGGSWRLLEMVGVLGVWSVVGLVVAPLVLRRTARRESGSSLAARRRAARAASA